MLISNSKRIVIKIGSSLLVNKDYSLRKSWFSSIIKDICELKKQDKEIIIVSSGAVAMARHLLAMSANKIELERKQALAAIGQVELIKAYSEELALHGQKAAQLLLSPSDTEHNRRRYLNARDTLKEIAKMGIIPIINENDVVATSELRFGDNDRLAARTAQMAEADLLILFSDIDGLYDKDPNLHKEAKFIDRIEEITPEIEAMAGDSSSNVGTGGMITKIMAARIATSSGCHMILCSGKDDKALSNLQNGGKHSLFLANIDPMTARKKWIAGMVEQKGILFIDDGAKKALQGDNSLLPVGVKEVSGDFARGDCVAVKDMQGNLLAKGLVAFDIEQAKQIIGKKSHEVEQILGYSGRSAIIDRSDLVILV